ncbi:MAG: hypothetical protein ACR2IE_00790 [Candidatus Sumerlaeaceae bacterium]
MPRFARVVVTGEPYHITSRGNHRAAVFFEPEDREVYPAMLAAACHLALLNISCEKMHEIALLVSRASALGMYGRIA